MHSREPGHSQAGRQQGSRGSLSIPSEEQQGGLQIGWRRRAAAGPPLSPWAALLPLLHQQELSRTQGFDCQDLTDGSSALWGLYCSSGPSYTRETRLAHTRGLRQERSTGEGEQEKKGGGEFRLQRE